MAYQAGQAFIQTVPSLKGFVRKVRADLKTQFGANPIDVPVKPDADWTPLKREATKEGADAGGAFAKTFRARVDAALKAIPDIKVGADTSEADLELAGLRTRLQALRDVRVGVDLDAGEAQAEVAAISTQLQRLSRDDARIDVQTNTGQASAELAKISGQAARLDGKDVEIDVHVDRDGIAASNIAAVGRSMQGLLLAGGLLAPTFLPAIGAITVAAGGLASAFTSAAVGGGAFAAAVIPAITNVNDALTAVEQAAKSRTPAAFQKAEAAMAALTPLQRELYDGFGRLREAFIGWSRSLESATLPVLIQGMELLQQGLPLLSPIVESAARGFGRLLTAASEALGAPFWRSFFDFLARTAGPSIEAFGRIFGNLAALFAALVIAFEPVAVQFLGWLIRLTEGWANWAKNLDSNDGFKRFLQFVSDNAGKLEAFFAALWGALVNIGRALLPLAGPMLDALTGVLNFVAKLPPPVLAGIAAGFLAIGASLALMNGVIAALAANPIILVIAALVGLAVGFYVAYQRSEEFRNGVDRVLREVGKVVRWLYEEVWKPTWDALVELYETSLKPVLKELGRLFTEVIGPAIKWLMVNVLGPFYKLMTWIFVKVLAPVIGWFLRNIVRPIITAVIEIFKFLGRIINWLWKHVVKPVFKFIGDAFGAVGRFFRKIWNDYLFPVFDLLGAIIKTVWRGVIKPIFEGLKISFKAVGTAFKWVWNKVLKPVLEAFGNFFAKHVQPKIDAFVGAVQDIWGGLKNIFRGVINFVIEWVINKGLIKAFNKVADFFGTKKMAEVPLIGKSAAEAGAAGKKNKYPTQGGKRIPEFASGGVIPGTRTIRDSVYIHARPDEAVMVPQFTDQVGGERGVHTLNRMAERGQLRALLGEHAEGFAGGGVVSYKGHSFTEAMVARIKNAEKLAGTAFSIFQGGFRPYTSYSKGTHGKDAIDNGPVTSAVVAAMRKSGIVAWDRTGKGNWAPHIHGIPVPGGGVQLSPSARSQYEQYLQGGDGLGGTDTGPKVTGGGGAVGGFELPGWIKKIFGGPLKWLKDVFSDKLAGLRAKLGDSPIVNAVMGIPRKISTAVKKYFVDKFSGGSAATSGLTKIGKTANAAKSYAQSQMGKFGWGGDQFSALLELWERESNWNYLAKNPSSGAYGIPQSLPGSKMAAFGKDWRTNPATQINWGLDYIDDRHDSPRGALRFHDANNWYDDGGFLPPLNGTGKPEPVLTDAQWNAIVTNAKRGMDMPEIHVYVGDDEITEIVRVEMREQNRTLKRFVGAMGEAL